MRTLQLGRFSWMLDRPRVMGVVNITPDSFSDGGRYLKPDHALRQIDLLVSEGADIVDLGGESTRPGAVAVSAQQEMDRVLPVLEALRGAPFAISLDSRRAAVMQAALALDVDLINAVDALEDEGALAVVAASPAAGCLMHKRGEPAQMQTAPEYQDVVAEVAAYLDLRADMAVAAGIKRERILLDPGFGFGKTLAHNLALFRALPTWSARPLLIGVSRKSMLGQITGRPVDQRLPASIAAALLAAQSGAAVIRVHDVAATVDALKVWQAVTAGE